MEVLLGEQKAVTVADLRQSHLALFMFAWKSSTSTLAIFLSTWLRNSFAFVLISCRKSLPRCSSPPSAPGGRRPPAGAAVWAVLAGLPVGRSVDMINQSGDLSS